jgi:hypothetical protein
LRQTIQSAGLNGVKAALHDCQLTHASSTRSSASWSATGSRLPAHVRIHRASNVIHMRRGMRPSIGDVLGTELLNPCPCSPWGPAPSSNGRKRGAWPEPCAANASGLPSRSDGQAHRTPARVCACLRSRSECPAGHSQRERGAVRFAVRHRSTLCPIRTYRRVRSGCNYSVIIIYHSLAAFSWPDFGHIGGSSPLT